MGDSAGVAQLVEQLICNQLVGGSSPFTGSLILWAGVVEWLMAPGCKPGRRQPYVGSNPTPCTSFFWLFEREWNMGGCSSVGRASAFQAEGREFESRRPLQVLFQAGPGAEVAREAGAGARGADARAQRLRPRSSVAERILGKDEAMGSIPIAGSLDWFTTDFDCKTR